MESCFILLITFIPPHSCQSRSFQFGYTHVAVGSIGVRDLSSITFRFPWNWLGKKHSSAGKESACNTGDLGWIPGYPWRRERLPTPVFWHGESHGLYSPWGYKESDTTESLSLRRMCTGPFPCFFVSRNSPLPSAEFVWKGGWDEGLWASHFPVPCHVFQVQVQKCSIWHLPSQGLALGKKDKIRGALPNSCLSPALTVAFKDSEPPS